MNYKTVFIASDHAGLEMKQSLIKKNPNLPWKDLGTFNEASVDYPDYAEKLCLELKNRINNSVGILICGSGQGMAIRANRFGFIRAALCWNDVIAKMAREHNNANVLCLPGRYIDADSANKILKVFLETDFAGGRHQIRVDKLTC